MEAMFRAMVMRALEGDVVAFREVMELVGEFGIGMQSRLTGRKLPLELSSHLLEFRKRLGHSNRTVRRENLWLLVSKVDCPYRIFQRRLVWIYEKKPSAGPFVLKGDRSF
jgi:endonuclease/exonuclease/phosphatase family metal-dependent hydrolase